MEEDLFGRGSSVAPSLLDVWPEEVVLVSAACMDCLERRLMLRSFKKDGIVALCSGYGWEKPWCCSRRSLAIRYCRWSRSGMPRDDVSLATSDLRCIQAHPAGRKCLRTMSPASAGDLATQSQ